MGHLTRNVTEDHIKEIFSTFGAIKSVELSVDKARTTMPELCFAISCSAQNAALKDLEAENPYGLFCLGSAFPLFRIVTRWVWKLR